MKKPLLWNTLDDAAGWLTDRTGENWTVRQVINAALTTYRDSFHRGLPTRLKLAAPIDTKFSLAHWVRPGEGPEFGFVFKGPIKWDRAIPLYHFHVSQLLVLGETSVGIARKPSDNEDHDQRWIWIEPKDEGGLRVIHSMVGITDYDLESMASTIVEMESQPKYNGPKRVMLPLSEKARLINPPANESEGSGVPRLTTNPSNTAPALPVVLGGEPQPQQPVGPTKLAPAQADPLGWYLKKPERIADSLATMIYNVLKEARDAGEPCPKAREVMERLEKKKPRDFIEIIGNEIKFYDADGDPDSKNIGAVRGRIRRATGAR